MAARANRRSSASDRRRIGLYGWWNAALNMVAGGVDGEYRNKGEHGLTRHTRPKNKESCQSVLALFDLTTGGGKRVPRVFTSNSSGDQNAPNRIDPSSARRCCTHRP